ncbi:energy transducer TonB [Beggiatoa leptomitoformis]|uniref:TonB family protein n=1 Tax=Beggiatoa leptomitoformis TaxID=288004 RepID=A0A2N9YBZ8_9GAMM|nr:energy transducer TonB [Beggiatoa leptomitoformis]ALG69278.2 TonB family protein [Beggiatoa leptomitoformis]AUI68003.1 TonB family protein [Beggiatoa leptomitoformis]
MKYASDMAKSSLLIGTVILLHILAIWQLWAHGVAATVIPPTPPTIMQVSLTTLVQEQPVPKPEAVVTPPQPTIPTPVIEKVVEKPRTPEKKIIEKPRRVKKIEKPRKITPKPVEVTPPTPPIEKTIEIPVQVANSPAKEIPKTATPSVSTPTKTKTDTPTTSTPTSQPVFNAAYLNNPAPVYPLLSKRRGEQGKVRLRVNVNAEGRAEKLEVAISSGYEQLDQAALVTVKQWRFVPAKRGTEAVSAWVIVPINFQLEG